MNYARWETEENMKKYIPLIPVDGKEELKTLGLPILYDNSNLYITEKLNHTLVIGSQGSGKTQVITLPLLELSRMAGESVFVQDMKNELYGMTKDKFKESGYDVIKINFDDLKESNMWNPFDLAYKLYNDGNEDKAQDMLEEIGFYLLTEEDESNLDPFWTNSAINYFVGLSLYAFENKKEVNFTTIRDLDILFRENEDIFKDKFDKRPASYINLLGILNAPNETKGSILSVFSQKMKKFLAKEKLNEILSKSDFDITSVAKKKSVIYVSFASSTSSERLISLLISQLYCAKDEYSKEEGRINFVVDNTIEMYPIRNFSKMLVYSRTINISFVFIIKGFCDLKNKYGNEEAEIIKMCFPNLIYLLSQDINTLEEVSNLCGKTDDDGVIKSLISVEELKTLKMFEAIILLQRMMPIKTKLLPYYEFENRF